MKLRTDTVGHFDNPTEDILRGAIVYSGEGGQEGDLVKLMVDEDHFLCIWVGQRSAGHRLTLRSGPWKVECTEKLSSEMVLDLMSSYLREDLSPLKKLPWTRPLDKIFLDNIRKLQAIANKQAKL